MMMMMISQLQLNKKTLSCSTVFSWQVWAFTAHRTLPDDNHFIHDWL